MMRRTLASRSPASAYGSTWLRRTEISAKFHLRRLTDELEARARELGWSEVIVETDLFGRERYLLARRSAAT